jgi:hypothetical protein
MRKGAAVAFLRNYCGISVQEMSRFMADISLRAEIRTRNLLRTNQECYSPHRYVRQERRGISGNGVL